MPILLPVAITADFFFILFTQCLTVQPVAAASVDMLTGVLSISLFYITDYAKATSN